MVKLISEKRKNSPLPKKKSLVRFTPGIRFYGLKKALMQNVMKVYLKIHFNSNGLVCVCAKKVRNCKFDQGP